MKQRHCCRAVRGSGFGVQYGTSLMLSDARGTGRWLQFMHCAYLLLWSRYFKHKYKGEVQGWSLEFGVWSLSEGIGLKVQSAGVRVRLYLKSYRSRARQFQYTNCRIVTWHRDFIVFSEAVTCRTGCGSGRIGVGLGPSMGTDLASVGWSAVPTQPSCPVFRWSEDCTDVGRCQGCTAEWE